MTIFTKHTGSGHNQLIEGTENSDRLFGGKGNDTIEGYEDNDSLFGGADNDVLDGGFGEDVLFGDGGRDILLSRSDAGEPEIAQETDEDKVYPDQPFLDADDLLIGGGGADTFRFELLVNAKEEIYEQYRDPVTGLIDWHGVTGENDNVHDHWVDAIGNDVISDFKRNQGDKIEILGHTVEADIEYVDKNKNGRHDGNDYSVIQLWSNQGGAGAHDGDLLGTITVYGNKVLQSDLMVDSGVHYGAFDCDCSHM